MSKLLLLGSWHAGANCTQYAAALRALGHEVETCGPRFTQEDADRWRMALMAMEWAPTPQEADEYVAKVLRESPKPDIETRKGEQITWGRSLGYPDAVISFWQYGESPTLAHHPQGVVPCAAVFGDTHTGHLSAMVHDAQQWDHMFVQFRRSDMKAFTDAGHKSVHWLPAAADSRVWKPYPETERDLDCVFVGSTHPQVHRDRVDLIRYLQANWIDVQVKHAFGSDAARLMARAKVVLNRSLAGDCNMRVPEAIMAGANLLTDDVDGLTDLGLEYGFHYTSYQSPEDALGQIRFTLAHNVAHVGRDLALETMTYEHRARQMLAIMGLPEEGNGSTVHQGDTRLHDAGYRVDPRPSRVGRVGAAVQGTGDVQSVGHSGDTGTAHGEDHPVLVSVIVPAFNHWDDCTGPLIRHLADDAAVRSSEVLIVDDGSTDATATTGRVSHPHSEHEWLRVPILHKPNGGFCSAVNYGVRHAKGEYVVILNNDTTPERGFLDPLIEELQNGAGIVGSQILNPDGTIQARGLRQAVDGSWGNWDGPINAPWPGPGVTCDVESIQGACFAMRRDTFLRLGGLDESWGNGGCCEVDLSLRVAKEGLPVRLRLDSKVRHAEGSTRFHTEGIQEKIAENTRRIIERWGMPDVRNGNADSGSVVLPDSGSTRRRGGDVPVSRGVDGGRRATAEKSLTVVWEGPLTVADGGSLGLINYEVPTHLVLDGPGGLVVARNEPGNRHQTNADLWVSHYFSPDGWEAPPPDAKHWAIIVPWELGPTPEAWKKTADDPRLKVVFTPSAYSKRLLSPLFGAERITVIPNGVSTALYYPDGPKWKQESYAYRFLYVGGRTQRKGFDLLLEAWRRAFAGAEAVKLIVKSQGDTSFYSGQTIAVPTDLPNVQLITRHLEDADLAALYRSCDALVCPSRAEGWHLPTLEAMSTGLPVLRPDTDPWNEYHPHTAGLALTVHNRGGFTEVDVDGLAKALRWMFLHSEDGRTMGKVGREAALAFDWSKIAEKYAAKIREICA